MLGQSTKEGQKNTGRGRQKPNLCLSVSKMQDSDLDCALPPRRHLTCHNNMPWEMVGPQPGAPPTCKTDLSSSTGLHLLFPSSILIHLICDDFWMGEQQRVNRATLPLLPAPGLVWCSENLQIHSSPYHDGHPILVHRPWTMEDIKLTSHHRQIEVWNLLLNCVLPRERFHEWSNGHAKSLIKPTPDKRTRCACWELPREGEEMYVTFQGHSVEVYVQLIQIYVSIVVKRDMEPKTDQRMIHLKRLIDSGRPRRRGRNRHL